jgi:asparagine synthase (glutamine-hydrolysing)
MVRIIKHRGPDEQNLVYINTRTGNHKYLKGLNEICDDPGNLFLGHARLSIIDLATGSQPMSDDSGKLWIIFNGEIYNYVELKRQLENNGFHFRTTSDTEVILVAYKAFGSDCVNRFNGMFSFAIYDSTKNIIFCARDRLGIKPLYYYRDRGKFIFASEIKSLLSQPDVDKSLDYNGIADYLTFQHTLENKTFFKEIKSLGAGQTMIVERARIFISQYWEPDLEPEYSMTENQAVEGLAAILDDAINIHIRSDVQIGTSLSGGLDSSAISTIAARKYGKSLFTFTGKFDDSTFYDESPYAIAVAKQINSRSFLITPTVADFAKYFARMIWHLDQPVVGPGVFPQFMVSKIAGNNLKVVLGGQGGDEIFLGYPRYIRSMIENKFLYGGADDFAKNNGYLSLGNYYLRNYGVSGVAGWALKRKLSKFNQRYIKTIAPLYGFHNYFTGALADTLHHYSPEETALNQFGKINSTSLANKMSWYDTTNYLGGLLQVEDRTSMAWSLESRVPLLDYRIVEWAMKIPSSLKIKNLQPKYMFRKAVEQNLPELIRNRTDKRGFPTPLNLWFDRELLNFANSFVSFERLDKRGLYHPKILGEFFKSRRHYLTPALSRQALLWPLINLEMWFQLFVDNVNNDQPQDGLSDQSAVIGNYQYSR